MSKGRKYRKPPVIEALCEIHFSGSEWDDTVPGRFFDKVSNKFPAKKQRTIQEAQVTFSQVGEATAGIRSLPPWMQFTSAKGDRMIQLGRDVLVVNQLLPYPRFEDWEPAIYSALDVYREIAQPKQVARLGVRYINSVVIPQPRIAMEEFFTIYPRLPQALGNEHGPFMLRVEIPAQDAGHVVLITFGTIPADRPGETSHLLDLYDTLSLPGPVSPDGIRTEVRRAHANVEAAFESSVTAKLRTLFEPEVTT